MAKCKKFLVLICAAALCCLCLAACSSGSTGNSTNSRDMTVSDTGASTGDGSIETEPFWVLIVGNDSRINTSEYGSGHSDNEGHSDTIMIARIDPVNYDICIVTVPRDTQTTVDGATCKINDSYLKEGQCEGLTKQIESLTGVSCKYYLDCGFISFEDFVNAFGGVTVDVPVTVSLPDIVAGGDDITIKAGKGQKLDGVDALVFCRARHEYATDLDACRQIQDRQVVVNMIQQVLNDPDNATTYMNALTDNAKTNWNVASFNAQVQDFIDHADQVSIRNGTGPYAGDIQTVEDGEDLWLATRDEDTWAQVIAAAEESGSGDIDAIVPLPDVEAAS